MNDLYELSKIINILNGEKEINDFLSELLTESEISVLSKRWHIMKMLQEGLTQREIAKNLSVSLCKVTRGAKILKNKNAITTKILKEG